MSAHPFTRFSLAVYLRDPINGSEKKFGYPGRMQLKSNLRKTRQTSSRFYFAEDWWLPEEIKPSGVPWSWAGPPFRSKVRLFGELIVFGWVLSRNFVLSSPSASLLTSAALLSMCQLKDDGDRYLWVCNAAVLY